MKKTNPIRNIEVDVADVSIAKSKALEPFIKTLVAPPENVMQEPLGMLVGLFSVSDRKDSSAYVVNYLASIAKKEYFLNPRRGAIESFESMLHHTNLALAEIVKNGQASWVGSLHGAIAIIEKGNIHFSLTGDAKIFLFRNDRLSDISEGLASPDAATHPLKTFVEISSGRLSKDDCVLLASPEVFEIFTFSELDRNARRLMPEKKFSRFLETALRNELTLGGALLLNTKEAIVETTAGQRRKIAKEKSIVPPNAWSATAFEQQRRVEADNIDLPDEPVVIQHPRHERFGDIYVQGDAPERQESHPVITSFAWRLEDARRTIGRAGSALKRSFSRKLSDTSSSIMADIQDGFLLIRRSLKKIVPKRERSEIRTPAQTEPEPAKKETPATIQRKSTASVSSGSTETPKSESTITRQKASASLAQQNGLMASPGQNTAATVLPKPKNAQANDTGGSVSLWNKKFRNTLRLWRMSAATDFPKASPRKNPFHALAVFLRDAPWKRCYPTIRKTLSAGRKLLKIVLHGTFEGLTWLKRKFFTLPPKQQLLGIAGIAFVLTSVGIIIRHAGEPEMSNIPTIEPTVESKDLSMPDGERNATIVDPTASFPVNETVTSVFLNGKLFVITKTGVVDTESGAAYESPAAPILAATAMDDLSAIFLLTENRQVYTFYPVNGVFAQNNITLPTNIATNTIGTFLTYLYAFDRGERQILRYPRAEGGFGDGKNWLREPISFDDPIGFAVSENIYIASSSDVAAFFHGKQSADFTFEKPATPLSVTAICANPDIPDIFAILDSAASRLIIYSNTGAITKQLFSKSFAQATSCAISSDSTKIASSSDNGTSVFEEQ